jgi:hypothetical protein
MSTSPSLPGQTPEEPDPAGDPGWGDPLPSEPDNDDLEPVRENAEPA